MERNPKTIEWTCKRVKGGGWITGHKIISQNQETTITYTIYFVCRGKGMKWNERQGRWGKQTKTLFGNKQTLVFRVGSMCSICFVFDQTKRNPFWLGQFLFLSHTECPFWEVLDISTYIYIKKKKKKDKNTLCRTLLPKGSK